MPTPIPVTLFADVLPDIASRASCQVEEVSLAPRFRSSRVRSAPDASRGVDADRGLRRIPSSGAEALGRPNAIDPHASSSSGLPRKMPRTRGARLALVSLSQFLSSVACQMQERMNRCRTVALRGLALCCLATMAVAQIGGTLPPTSGSQAAVTGGTNTLSLLKDLVVSVKTHGAVGDGMTDDTAAIQSAIHFAEQRGGASVFFPAGRYRTTASLRVATSSVGLVGLGGASVLAPAGSFDTIVFASTTPATFIYYNRLFDLTIDEQAKTGGRLLFGSYNAQFLSERVVAYGGWSGASFDNFNNVSLSHLRLTDYRGGAGTHYLKLSGGTNGVSRSDVAYLMRCVFGGSMSLGMRGLDIDGFVHTVNGWACHFVNIGGEALHMRNTIAAIEGPAFVTMDDFECDYPQLECVRLDVGLRVQFNNPQMHGSRERSGIYVGNGVRTCTFTGGFVSGSRQAGIAIAGQDVVVSGMNFRANSSAQFGGTLGSYPGILVGFSSRGATVSGCRSGSSDAANFQSSGCQIDTGADDFVVVGNNFRQNVAVGVVNGAGVSSTKLVANNI